MTRGGLDDGTSHGRLERRSAGERAVQRRARPGDHVRILADRAERADQHSTQTPAVVGVARAAGEADLVEQRPQQRTGERLEPRPIRVGDQVLVDRGEAARDFLEHAARALTAVAGGEGEIVGGAVPSGAHQRPFVVQQHEPLGRGEVGFDPRRERAQHLRRIGGPVVAVRALIDEHPRRAGAGDVQRQRLVGHDLARRRGAAGHLDADRNLPAAALGARAVDHEALLLQGDGRLVVLAREGHVEQRHTRLIDEGRQDALDRLARGAGDRLAEVLRRRVARGVRLQIGVDPLLERLGANVAFEHAQHRRAFLIRDRVECLVDLRRRGDVGMNRPGRAQRVERERGPVLFRLVDVDVPVGVRGGQRLVGHPRREPFVQPDVVPPLHRDKIAKPLVGHLVREDRGDLLPGVDRRRLGLGEQIGLAVENRAGVFHRSGREVRNRDDVELAERIFDGIVRVVELQNLLRRVERQPAHLPLVRRRADPDRDVVGRAVEAFEVADRHRHQVRRHLCGGRELDCVLRHPRSDDVRYYLAVGNGGVAAIDDQRDAERRLERGLVEARKCAAGVGRLELRHRVFPQLGPADVEAAQLRVEHAAERRVDLGRAFRERPGHRQRRGLAGFVERHRRLLSRGAAADRHLVECQLERVEHDFGRRLGHLRPNRLGPVEPLAAQIDHEFQVVVGRGDDGRKSLGGRG